MYESFYGLREKPFSLLPDPDFLYLGGRYRTALGLLEYGLLNQAGFIVITGETGTGKTTLLRKLLAEGQEECVIGILAYTHGGWSSIMPWILMAFSLAWKGKDPIEQFQAFSEFVMEKAVSGLRVVLIVDEAQNLMPAMLEELRLLSNLNADKSPMLQIILSGQPALRTLLQRPELTQFAQRVAVECTLEAMDERDTYEYIRHRIRVAGGNPDVFTPQACTVVHRLTGGMPRLVNQVCDMALAYGYAEQTRLITVRLVTEAARDRSTGCVLPFTTQVDLSDLKDDAKAVALPPDHSPRSSVTPPSIESPNVSTPDRPMQHEAMPRPSSNHPQSAQLPRNAPPRQPSLPEEPASPDQTAVTPEQWLQRGQFLRQKGRHKDALRALAEAARDPALSFRAYSEAGFCYREAGRMNEAVEAFRKAFSDRTAARDDRVAVCYELGRTLETARKPAEALDCYQRVSRVDASFQDVARRIERLSGELPGEKMESVRGSRTRPEHTNGSRSFWESIQRLFGLGVKARAADTKRR